MIAKKLMPFATLLICGLVACDDPPADQLLKSDLVTSTVSTRHEIKHPNTQPPYASYYLQMETKEDGKVWLEVSENTYKAAKDGQDLTLKRDHWKSGRLDFYLPH